MLNHIILSFLAIIFAFSSSATERILVQGAMDSEVDYLIASIQHPKEERIGAWTFWKGKLGKNVIIVSRTEVGLVNASAATAIGIKEYKPTLIINQGTAGAHDPVLRQGDLVLGKSTLNMGAMIIDNKDKPYGEFFDVTQRTRDDNNNKKENKAFYSDKSLLSVAGSIKYSHGKSIHGIIGSADQWNKNHSRIKELHQTFSTSAEEMETVAAAQVASTFSIPFLSIRVISNSALHGEEFNELTAQWCQEFTVQVMKHL